MARSCSMPPCGDFRHRGQHHGDHHIRIRHIREIRDEPPRVFCCVRTYPDVRNYIHIRVCVLRRRCLERRHSTQFLFQRLDIEILIVFVDCNFWFRLRSIIQFLPL